MLSNTRLGTAIKDRIKALTGIDLTAAEESDMEVLWQDIADEIIKEITTNAVVVTTVAVTSVTAVTPGAGVSGPGAGTGSGTIT